MTDPKKQQRKKAVFTVLSVLLAIAVWQIAAWVIHEKLILVSPWDVAKRLTTIWQEPDFFAAVWFSFSRIVLGYFAALAAGSVLAVAAGMLPVVEILLKPYMVTIKTVPVASFIVLTYVWLSSATISAFISFLIVLPTVYNGVLAGIKSIDAQIKEMANVFELSFFRRLLALYLPHTKPHLISAASLAAGLAWKSGIAAEILTVPADGSIGNMIYYAKLGLSSVDLFAWTVIIVLLSVAFEKLFTLLLRGIFALLEEIAFRPSKKRKRVKGPAPAVSFDAVSKRYGESTVLDRISHSFEPMSRTCIMGASGQGKTTLLRLVAGLESSDGGKVEKTNGKVSMVFQEDRLCENVNAIKNAMLGAKDVTKEKATRMLCALGLDGHLTKPVRSLSGGMRRRVSIARALLSDAKLILLDEAFKGLDEETKGDVIRVVNRKTKKKTVIAVTHEKADAELLDARILMLDTL